MIKMGKLTTARDQCSSPYGWMDMISVDNSHKVILKALITTLVISCVSGVVVSVIAAGSQGSWIQTRPR
jgi:ABC-type proline/glycine betaine transport system permease subunit